MPPDFLSGDEWPGSDHAVRDSRGTDAGLGLAVWPLPRSNGDAKGQEGGRGRVVADYGSGSQAMVDAGRCRTLRSRSWSAIGWRWTVARPRPSHPGFPSAGGTAANSRFAAMTAGRRWLSLDCRIRVGARDARVCYDTWGGFPAMRSGSGRCPATFISGTPTTPPTLTPLGCPEPVSRHGRRETTVTGFYNAPCVGHLLGAYVSTDPSAA